MYPLFQVHEKSNQNCEDMKREIPDECTLYPYPEKEYLCRTCFTKSLRAGLKRKRARGGIAADGYRVVPAVKAILS